MKTQRSDFNTTLFPVWLCLVAALITACNGVRREAVYTLSPEEHGMGGAAGDYTVLFDSAGVVKPMFISSKVQLEEEGDHPKFTHGTNWIAERLTYRATTRSDRLFQTPDSVGILGLVLNLVPKKGFSEGGSDHDQCFFEFVHHTSLGNRVTASLSVVGVAGDTSKTMAIRKKVLPPGKEVDCLILGPFTTSSSTPSGFFDVKFSAIMARGIGLIEYKVKYGPSARPATDSVVYRRPLN